MKWELKDFVKKFLIEDKNKNSIPKMELKPKEIKMENLY